MKAWWVSRLETLRRARTPMGRLGARAHAHTPSLRPSRRSYTLTQRPPRRTGARPRSCCVIMCKETYYLKSIYKKNRCTLYFDLGEFTEKLNGDQARLEYSSHFFESVCPVESTGLEY